MAVLLVLYVMLLATHRLWLPGLGQYLIIKSELVKSDLIVVSTGSYARVRYAVELLKKGYASKMLLLGDTRYNISPVNNNILEIAEQEVLEEGIPVEMLVAQHSTSTRDDARLAKELMQQQGLKSAIIVSDNYNMRRLAMVFERIFKSSNYQLRYLPADLYANKYIEYWWESHTTFSYVLKEWIKYPINYILLVSGKETVG